MKTYRYAVMFSGGDLVNVVTVGFKSAVILACAKRIKDGKHIDASIVTNIDTAEDYRINEIKIEFVAK